jgi:hypothetical protein
MHYPDGYISPTDSPTTGCLLLLKSLYGLKQAPRIWNIEIDSFLKSLRFHPTDADPCVYSRRESTSSFTFIGLYVDDLILVGTRLILDSIKPILNEKFGITDLGPIKYCLGFEIIRSPHSLSLLMHQHSYIVGILSKSNMSQCAPCSTPWEPSVKLLARPPDCTDDMTSIPYRATVGSLLYAAHGTRPDIAAAVGVV